MPVLAQIDMSVEPDRSVQRDLIGLVVSFTKNGRPSVQDLEWRPISDPDDINFLRIATGGVSVENGLFQG